MHIAHNPIVQQWLRWLLNLLAVVSVGLFAFPLIRSQPESMHSFAAGLSDWQRGIFLLVISVLVAELMFKLFTPHINHLRYVDRNPPTWLAWLVGFGVLGVIDLTVGLSPERYKASAWEWVLYGLVPVLVVSTYRWAFAPWESLPEPKPQAGNQPAADWNTLEEWLHSDAPADQDFLGNYAVAQRIKRLLEKDTRSVGIVGPFGAGKTSIVKWLADLAKADKETKPRLLISEHSCWNFDSSSSSIHAMLADAIAKVGGLVDTFYVSSLPESYRQTFSSYGGELVDKVSKLIFVPQNPLDQFSRLSALLGDMEVRLVFVVEDLDRNDSRSFDIQEVQAFLHQLKKFPNLCFVLTGGLASAGRIDFAKLCDHIEYMQSIDHRFAADIVQRVCDHCMDSEVFSHEVIAEPDRHHVWAPLTDLMMRDLQEMSLPQAVATLLNTPRSLRHALGRTYTAWRDLCGEIDWNHLLAVNVLRFAAPEAFLFLLRRWDRLREQPPSDWPQIRQAVLSDWNQTIQNVEWNPTAVRTVIKLILPASESWLVEGATIRNGDDSPQGVQIERYWRRAVNEAIAPGDVRDQAVISDLQAWLAAPAVDSQLIEQLCASSAYSDLWEELAGRFLADQPDRILLLCEHVLTHIRNQHGAAASHDSQGFVATLRFANKRVPRRAENRVWLEKRIDEAACTSIELVNGLWQDYESSVGRSSILRSEDTGLVRKHVIKVLHQQLVDAAALARVFHESHPYSLFHLVFHPSNDNSEDAVSPWNWLACPVLDSLRQGNPVIAIQVAYLAMACKKSNSARASWTVVPSRLKSFFGEDASEVIKLLGQLASQVTDQEHRDCVTAVAESDIAELDKSASDD